MIKGSQMVWAVVLLVAAGMWAVAGAATTYHVDGAHGSDANNGLTPATAFKTVQKGIDTAQDGDTVLVWPGVYQQALDFAGKAITLASAAEAAVLEAPDDYAVSFYNGEGPDSVLRNFIIRNSLCRSIFNRIGEKLFV